MFDFFIKGPYNNSVRGDNMNTDYNLYKIFLYLYEEKSISKTASKLYVSQPAISYSLKELENQLGYTLFYRNSKGIEPTMEAKELYGYISTAFHILNDAEEHIKNLNQLNIGCIRVGVPAMIGGFYLSSIISEFHKNYPGIQFEIISKSSTEMIDMLETRKLDLVIDSFPVTSSKNVTRIPLKKFTNGFVYSKKLGKVSISSLEDLSKYSLLLPNTLSTSRIKLEEYLDDKKIKLTPEVESSPEVMLSMIREGVGIGYLPKEFIQSQKDADDFEFVSFEGLPTVDIQCIYLNEFLTAASSKFVQLLKEE